MSGSNTPDIDPDIGISCYRYGDDIVPDIDPDIRYVVYDIGYMMTRYRAAVTAPHIHIVSMHPYCCNVNVVKLSYINHLHHHLAWHLTELMAKW
jgi:hypothetical protein